MSDVRTLLRIFMYNVYSLYKFYIIPLPIPFNAHDNLYRDTLYCRCSFEDICINNNKTYDKQHANTYIEHNVMYYTIYM